MLSMMNRFMTLPRPVQGGILLATGGGLIAALYFFLPPRMLYIFIMGMVLVAMILIGYRAMLKKKRKRKAAKLEKNMSDHAAASAPAGAQPAARARLDDLRTRFEDGVKKFRAVGKNLYELPWYVLVGESGSGKTEAIRHCNIGFPPGLQDKLQGTGGTIDMNWWFTDNAVILDTAGRLMFEEAAASEWKEFLKLVLRNRPNCPINGMLLVIPIDSLIKDTAEEIEKKGSRIAQQFDLIQRELGVRFPVFVVITKCDLLNGFREFFDNVTDPDLQHQMLGWSNPADLDEPFNPERVGEFLDTVINRLYRRRLRLLLEPIHTEDPNARRADQVDALYSFPQSLTRIAPRLQRYLEMVFTAGTWSAKPLFLRGIYFTSSMRQGSALDEELAEMLGQPVESLPEGHVWAEDRAYFLRDLFIRKIFKERGLVTRATNARRNQRVRRAVVLTAGFLSVLILAVFTWLGMRSLDKTIGAHKDYWEAAANQKNWKGRDGYWNPIVTSELKGGTEYWYAGGTEVEIGDKHNKRKVPLEQFYQDLRELTSQEIHIPWIFRFAATLGESINEDRRAAYQRIFLDGVPRPLVDAVRWKMAKTSEDQSWSPEATAALVQLLRIEAAKAVPAGRGKLELEPMMRYVLKGESYKQYQGEPAGSLQRCLDETLTGAAGWAAVCRSLDAGSAKARESIFTAVNGDPPGGANRFIDYWADPENHAGEELKKLFRLKALFADLNAELDQYARAEQALLEMQTDMFGARVTDAPTTLEQYRKGLDAWRNALFKTLTERKQALDKCIRGIEAEVGGLVEATPAGVVSMVEAYRVVSERIEQRSEHAFDVLLNEIPEPVAEPADPDQQEWLQTIRQAIAKAREELKSRIRQEGLVEQLAARNTALLAAMKPKPDQRTAAVALMGPTEQAKALGAEETWRLYEARYVIYAIGAAQLAAADEANGPAELTATIGKLTKTLDEAQSTARDLWAEHQQVFDGKGTPVAAMPALIDFAGRMARRGRIHALIKGVLAEQAGLDELKRQVTKAAGGLRELKLPAVPMSKLGAAGGVIRSEYHIEAAHQVLSGWQTVGGLVGSTGEAPKNILLDRDALAALYRNWGRAAEAYVGAYLDYWTDTVPHELDATAGDWAEYHAALGVVTRDLFQVQSGLQDTGKLMQTALTEIMPVAPAHADRIKETSASVASSLVALQRTNAMERWRHVLRKWRGLTADPAVARAAVLDMTPDDVLADLVPFQARKAVQIDEMYWRGLTLKGLGLLAGAAQDSARKAWTQLKTSYLRFPLVQPAPAVQALTTDEVAKARALLTSTGYAVAPTGGATARQKKVGEGALTSDVAVDEQLDRLRGLALTGADRKLRDQLGAVAAALPYEGQIRVKIAVLAMDEQPKPNFFEYWAGPLEVQQGGGTAKRLLKGAEVECGKGAAALTFRVFRYPGDKDPSRVAEIPGPWSAIRLLHAGQVKDRDFLHGWSVKRRDTDGAKWRIELTVDDNQTNKPSKRSVLLELEFPRRLPRIEDWPAAP